MPRHPRESHSIRSHKRAWNSTAPYPPPPPLYPEENIPMSVKPYHIDDSVPTEEEVKWAVRRVRGHRSVLPYRMRAEHLWEWLLEH